MNLSQHHLSAFTEIVRLGSFTKAADSLGLTQSALSHRIRNLEENIETTVFVRIGNKIQLTETGSRLLQFCRLQAQAEGEFLADIKPKKLKSGSLSGLLRIGGFSSVMRSLILPAVSRLIRSNPEVRLEFLVRELSDLPSLLTSGQVDFLITADRIQRSDLEEVFLGYEEYVLATTSKKMTIPDVYLDFDQEDQTTFEFLKIQGQKNLPISRSFLDDLYGVLDATIEGLGKAVLPLHVAAEIKEIEIVKNLKPLLSPVYFYRFKQPYYTRLHQAVHEKIKTEVSSQLLQKK